MHGAFLIFFLQKVIPLKKQFAQKSPICATRRKASLSDSDGNHPKAQEVRGSRRKSAALKQRTSGILKMGWLIHLRTRLRRTSRTRIRLHFITP